MWVRNPGRNIPVEVGTHADKVKFLQRKQNKWDFFLWSPVAAHIRTLLIALWMTVSSVRVRQPYLLQENIKSWRVDLKLVELAFVIRGFLPRKRSIKLRIQTHGEIPAKWGAPELKCQQLHRTPSLKPLRAETKPLTSESHLCAVLQRALRVLLYTGVQHLTPHFRNKQWLNHEITLKASLKPTHMVQTTS